MTAPTFMSEEHIALMNRILATDHRSLDACSRLPKNYLIVYELEKEGDYVYWQMIFDKKAGIRFALGEPVTDSDVVLTATWRSVIEAERRRRAGDDVNPFTVNGSEEALTIVNDAFSAGAKAAKLDTRLPSV